MERILAPPALAAPKHARTNNWTILPLPPQLQISRQPATSEILADDPTESELRQQPELSRVKPVERNVPIDDPFEIDADGDEPDDDAVRNNRRIASFRASHVRCRSIPTTASNCEAPMTNPPRQSGPTCIEWPAQELVNHAVVTFHLRFNAGRFEQGVIFLAFVA